MSQQQIAHQITPKTATHPSVMDCANVKSIILNFLHSAKIALSPPSIAYQW